MRSLTFTLDTQTGTDAMAPVTVTVTEQDNGFLAFTISNAGDGDNMIGDLRGLFFDVADDSLLGSLTVAGSDVVEVDQSGSVSNLGNGANVSGVPDGPYEVGIEFGTAGISGDDIQTTTFTLSSSLRGLTLDDISLEDIAVRQTSVGEADGARDASDKLYGETPFAVDAIDDSAATSENDAATGNVFANDRDLDAGDANGDGIPDGLTVTAVDGDTGLVGHTVTLDGGATVVIHADGSYEVDASGADSLSAGESIWQSFSVSVDDGHGGSDTATLTVNVTGVNDDPTAGDDTAATDEATAVSGSLFGNDSDVDRLDSIHVSAINGDEAAVGTTVTLDSGALVVVGADGSYSYDPNGAFDALDAGQTATDSFVYQIADGNGGFADATMSVTVTGLANETVEHVDQFGEFLNKKGQAQAISNVVFYLQSDDDEIVKVKVDGWNDGTTDLDHVNYGAFIDQHYAGYELLAVSIKAGNNHNADLGPGEGQLFLMDGDEDIDYTAGGPTPDGISIGVLGAHANATYQYSPDLFA